MNHEKDVKLKKLISDLNTQPPLRQELREVVDWLKAHQRPGEVPRVYREDGQVYLVLESPTYH